MDNVHIPPHQAHLQTQYSRVATFIGQDELNGITNSYPNETLTKDVRATCVDGVTPREPLTKMGVEPNLISASAASAEADRVQDGSGALCHEGGAFSVQVILGSFDRRLIISWLQ